MQNYFNYFTEIEEHFSRRRGSILLLSTLDWALIESWREAGVPLAAVLRGIDEAFDKHAARKSRGGARKVNGLAWAAQAVMEATEQMREAAVGAVPAKRPDESGLESARIAAYLDSCAREVATASGIDAAISEIAARLSALAAGVRAGKPKLEELERTLTVLEEKLVAVLLTGTPEAELLTLREQAAAALSPYRRRMGAVQIRQIEQQFLHKRLFDRARLPRLSLFYMPQSD